MKLLNQSFVVVLTSMLIGSAVGFAVATFCEDVTKDTDYTMTTTIPSFSAHKVGETLLEKACLHNDSIINLSKNLDKEKRTIFITTDLKFRPLSDRGIICEVVGRFETHGMGASTIKEEERRTLLVVPGSNVSEFVTPEFAEQLLKSKAVLSLGSNDGVHDTVVDLPKVVLE